MPASQPPIDPESIVLPPGIEAWEEPDFLPHSDIDFLEDFAKAHLAAVAEFAEAAQAADSHEDDAAEAMRAWRREARAAAAAGRKVPPKPDVDEADVTTDVLIDDVAVAREKLAVVVVEVLDGIQRPERLIAMRDVEVKPALARCLRDGFCGQIDLARAAAEREAVRLTAIATGGSIDDVTDAEVPDEQVEVIAA